MVQSMPKLEQSETMAAALPVFNGPGPTRPSLVQCLPTAAFVSQLLAARDRLMLHDATQRDQTAGAVGAYDRGARMAERRMPLGYRKTKLV